MIDVTFGTWRDPAVTAYNANVRRQADKERALVSLIAKLERELFERRNELRVTRAWLGEHPEKATHE